MRLFEMDDNKEVTLNKVWIVLIPEFRELLVRDKGGKGDYRGSKKVKATRDFTFIYFYADFSSPIRDWEDGERKKEALYYAGLEEKDLDTKLWAANEKYFELQMKASRPLRTLKALYKALEAMDEYFEIVDFKKTDKMGKLLHDPSDFVTNAGKLNKMYDELRNFEKRVEDDMKQSSATIRGPNSTLGDNEGAVNNWDEQDILTGSRHMQQGGSIKSNVIADTILKTAGSFQDILNITRQQAQKERAQKTPTHPSFGTPGSIDELLNDD